MRPDNLVEDIQRRVLTHTLRTTAIYVVITDVDVILRGLHADI
jgi:hypothetical protein